MMEIIADLPDDTVGIASKGRITEEDYKKIIIPAIEQALENHDKIKMLFNLSDMEGGMELTAMWEDFTFGVKHWTDFSHLALVTDIEWVKNMTAFFAMMVPADVKVFASSEEPAAREWLVTAKKQAA